MKKSAKKLILFDIDGTLLRATSEGISYWKIRMVEVFRAVFQKELSYDVNLNRINGQLERAYFRVFASELGVSKEEFDAKFPKAAALFHAMLKEIVEEKKVTFSRIEDAYTLVQTILDSKSAHIGLVTGNIEKNAWLKLKAIDFHTQFSFGGFGDVIEDRGELVKFTMQKATELYDTEFEPSDVIVIGDTVHDIRSAKKAGVVSLGVSTGATDTYETLAAEGADLVVRSLMDEQVFALLGLPQSDRKTAKKKHQSDR